MIKYSYENGVLIVSEADCREAANIFFKARSAVQIFDLENGVRFL